MDAVNQFLVVALAALATAQAAGRDGPAPARAVPADPPTTAQAAPRMTLRQAAGQRMVFAYAGLEPPAGLRRRIARGEAAGVILFSRNVRSAGQVRAVVRRLQAIDRPRGLDEPLLVMVDQEGGPVRRIPGAPARAAADSGARGTGAVRADGRAAARTLRGAGVNLDLAPVADVGRRGGAMARERRAYGTSASGVAARAAAFARGLRAGGVGATAKHFPGFGAAGANTDDTAVRITRPLRELRRTDAAPFRRLIAEGVEAVMLSTAVYPALDDRPAAFSRRWVTGELRGRLGHRGVVLTDDLQTPAVARHGGPAELAVLAARAGVDLPLFAQTTAAGAQAAAGLERAVRSGRLTRGQLEGGARRVLRLRRELGR